MSYALVLSKRFDRDFSKLDKEARDRVIEKLKEISRDPRVGKPLRGRFRGLYSARIGDYRIVYQISDEKQTVAVVMVGHRKAVYGRRNVSLAGLQVPPYHRVPNLPRRRALGGGHDGRDMAGRADRGYVSSIIAVIHLLFNRVIVGLWPGGKTASVLRQILGSNPHRARYLQITVL